MDMLKHIHAMQETAMALEQEARINGRYSYGEPVSDALIRGQKHGFAMLFDDSGGKPEIIPLGDNAGNVEVVKGRDPDNWNVTYNQAGPDEEHREKTERMVEESQGAYRQMNEEEFAKAAARSHTPGAKTAGRFEPTNIAGKSATGDKARLRELKATQDRNTAIAKRQYQEGILRTEKVAAAMKERSAAIHR